jgi:DNA-binding MurR/RpiR family transcriptional regulator
VFAISKAPYAHRTISTLKAASERGIPTIVITDNHASPALSFSTHSLIIPTESPHFFTSYVATLVMIETMITMLVARAGDEAEDMIRNAEDQIHSLGETWAT